MKKKIGFDFLCKNHEHHTYMIGLMKYNICDLIYIDKSADLDTPFKSLIKKNQRFIYTSLLTRCLSLIFHTLVRRNSISIIGINNYFIPLLIPFSIFNKINIHLHGQLYISISKYEKRWRILSKIFNFIVANPVSNAPDYIYKAKDFSSFKFLEKKEKNNNCLLYGSNKNYIFNKNIHSLIKKSGYNVIFLPAVSKYISWQEIISISINCNYTFLKLERRYFTVPSGRIGDLKILNFIPLVDKYDTVTQDILTKKNIIFKCI